MSIRKAPPILKNIERSLQPLIEEYIPNTYHGSAGVREIPAVHATKIIARIIYFMFFKYLSARLDIFICFIFNLPDINDINSVILPKAHRYPQKNRPPIMVTGITASKVIIELSWELHENVSWITDKYMLPTELRVTINNPGIATKEIIWAIWRINGVNNFFMLFSPL